MVQINFAQKTVNVKIVYYGPGMSGKTTNLEVVHQRAPNSNRGDLTSISTDGDRTLFFDYMPLDLGTVAGMRTCFQVYTVPGQVYYNSTRKLVLQGTDGVIFVADSAPSMMEQNLESLRNLEENLNEYGKSLATTPHVLQWNKRDLPDAVSVADMERHLNPHGAPTFEGVANTGQGVFPTLKSLAQLVLKTIMQEAGESNSARPASPAGVTGAGAMPVPPSAARPQAAPVPQAPVPRAVPQAAPGMGQAPMPPQPAAGNFGAAPAAQQQPAPNIYPDPHAAPPPQQPPGMPGMAGGVGMQQPGMQSMPPQQPVGMQQGHQMTAPDVRQRTAGEVMRPAGQAARPRAAQAQRKVRAQVAQKSSVPAPKRKKSAFSTGAFVLLAAGTGAVLAWAVLHFMKQG